MGRICWGGWGIEVELKVILVTNSSEVLAEYCESRLLVWIDCRKRRLTTLHSIEVMECKIGKSRSWARLRP